MAVESGSRLRRICSASVHLDASQSGPGVNSMTECCQADACAAPVLCNFTDYLRLKLFVADQAKSMPQAARERFRQELLRSAYEARSGLRSLIASFLRDLRREINVGRYLDQLREGLQKLKE